MAGPDVLLHMYGSPRDPENLETALAVTADLKGRLTGFYSVSRNFAVLPYAGMGVAYVPQEVIDNLQARAESEAAAAKQKFEAACQPSGLACRWLQSAGAPFDTLRDAARVCDLIVLGQQDPSQPAPAGDNRIPDELILACGRPVLAVPYAGQHRRVGGRVLIAWNGSRESTRAVHDALPFLVRAREIVVLTVGRPGSNDTPTSALIDHLAQHGLKASSLDRVADDISVGNIILSAAADQASDLLVMGAWGHSRLRELVLGGATRQILGEMTLPVLFSH